MGAHPRRSLAYRRLDHGGHWAHARARLTLSVASTTPSPRVPLRAWCAPRHSGRVDELSVVLAGERFRRQGAVGAGHLQGLAALPEQDAAHIWQGCEREHELPEREDLV